MNVHLARLGIVLLSVEAGVGEVDTGVYIALVLLLVVFVVIVGRKGVLSRRKEGQHLVAEVDLQPGYADDVGPEVELAKQWRRIALVLRW